jgi:biotin transporter BioY
VLYGWSEEAFVAEETVIEEMQRIGRTAGFMLTVPVVSLVMGWLTGHDEHVLAISIFFLLVAVRLLAFLAIMVHQLRTHPTSILKG